MVRKENSMKKKISIGAAIALMAVIATITFSVTMIFSRNQFDTMMQDIKSREAVYTKLAEVDATVRNNYIGEIDQTVLMDGITAGYMRGLGDRYAKYYTAEEYKKEVDSLNGNLVGIGVEVTASDSGYILVHDVYDGAPAQEAGIQKDDLIIAVNGTQVSMSNVTEMMNSLQGEPGTTLTLTVRRNNQDIPFEIVRKTYEIPTVKYRMIDGNAYIKITQFTTATETQFAQAIADAQADGATGIIFDLRDNPGGLVSAATNILDKLLPEGTIATATYKDGTTKVIATSDAQELNLPMVVLTNQNTASAAELFTQALRDYDKAKSVGTTTYGKGVMQQIEQLSDGSAIEYTVATYATAKSENFNGVGITPDFEKESTLDSTTQPTFEEVTVDNDEQFKKAVEVVNTLKQ